MDLKGKPYTPRSLASGWKAPLALRGCAYVLPPGAGGSIRLEFGAWGLHPKTSFRFCCLLVKGVSMEIASESSLRIYSRSNF